jgi:uncharacterized membrane protein YbhN (UPF0104 family)
MMAALRSRASVALSSRWLRLCVGIGLLALVIHWVDFGESLTIAANARVELLALLLLVLVADRLIAAFRWYLLVHGKAAAVTFWGIVRLVFVSGFAGYFTPGSVGVEAVRVYGMSRTTSNLAISVTSVLVERLFGLLALTLLVLVGLALRPPGLPPAYERLAWLALAVLIVGVCVLMSPRLRRLSLLVLAAGWLAPVRRGLQKIYAILDDYRRQPWLMLWSLGIAVVFQLNRCLLSAVGAAALGSTLPFVYFVVIVPIVALVSLMPISVAALGVREVAYVYLFGLVGMPAETALALALLVRASGLLLLLPGVWFYVRRGVSA